MDRDQEDLQFLGLFGIYAESGKLIFRCRKILTQIALALILPLCVVFLAHGQVLEILYEKIAFNEFLLEDTEKSSSNYHKLSDLVSTERAVYMLLKVLCFVLILAFSLLATSAVVYTVACVYTSREITFAKVMSVVPRVWKRLIVTFLCTFTAFFLYNSVFALFIYLWGATVADSSLGTAAMVVLLISYAVGFVYMTVIWQLGSVVAVLEDCCGFKAVMKSRRLIKGKMVAAVVIFVKVIVCLVVAYYMFWNYTVEWSVTESVKVNVGTGAVCVVVMMQLILLGLVVQTVVYFVCKSYHRENIDKCALSDHLELYYSGDYVPLTEVANKDVQLGEIRV